MTGNCLSRLALVASPRDRLAENLPVYLLWWGILAVVIAAAAWLIVWVRARYRDRADAEASSQLLLSQIRELRREGSLSEEEYRSIKGRLLDHLDGSARAADNEGRADDAGSADPRARSHDHEGSS